MRRLCMSGRLEIASNQLGELSGAIQMGHGEEVWVVIYELSAFQS